MRKLAALLEDYGGGSNPGTAFAHAGAGHYPTGWGYCSKKGSGGAVRARYRFTKPGEVEVWDRRSGQDEKDAVKLSFKDFDKEWRAL